MEVYYTLLVGFLFILAVSLLIIGVSNDAVNFLNSAIGAKAAPFKIILAVAVVGVLIGAVFSNGMMEVARKGIFHPEHFTFSEVMIIFLAVMLTNILLLDFFNTLGLPTSTTISIVFGILGAATFVSVYNVTRENAVIDSISSYINIESSGLIIAGIFLSVVIAFNAGMIIQWIVRLAFSFRIHNSYKYWSGIWGGIAVTVILYFLLIKGAKGSTLIKPEVLDFIKFNTGRIMLISFGSLTILFQLLVLFTRINILKIVVLIGTFALAMAFAGNDLVNFIGVPLAGFESFKAFVNSGMANPGGFMMTSLEKPVNTPVYFLIAAGLIMVLTLRFSKKAKSVTATTIDLSRQNEGSERFTSSSLARFIVRRTLTFSNGIARLTPPGINNFIETRFDAELLDYKNEEKTAFDLVRASVNLVVASILIAIGTSLRLPLSTTYVTFMVAMGTSLADGAWGRDSAVYRITGVLTVVGGWFFTAFSAFLASFVIALIIFFGKLPVILLLISLSVYILLKTHAFHKKRIKNEEELKNKVLTASFEILKSCDSEVKNSVHKVSEILCNTYTSFSKEKRKELKKLKKASSELAGTIKRIRDDLPLTLRKFEETDMESGHYYVQIVTYMKEMSSSLLHIVQPAFSHVDNNHSLDKEQVQKMKDFVNQIRTFFENVYSILEHRNFNDMDDLNNNRDKIISMANEILVSRIKILKKSQKGVKVSVTYIEMLTETKNLILNVVHLVKADARLINTFSEISDNQTEDIVDLKELQ